MSAALSAPVAAPVAAGSIEYTAARIVAAEAHHVALINADAGEDLITAALERAYGSRGVLAALPAQTVAELVAKLGALVGCVLHSRDEPARIEGDNGLAWSLLRDASRLIGGSLG